MRTLDETDIEILRLSTEDARRPYREIAEAANLSSPSVSDRVSRLQEPDITRRFMLDLDRSKLRGGIPILVELSVQPDAIEDISTALALTDGVEHVFTASDPRVVFQSKVSSGHFLEQHEHVALTNRRIVVPRAA